MPTDNRELIRGTQEVSALLGQARVAEREADRDLAHFLKLMGGEENITAEYAKKIHADRKRRAADSKAAVAGLEQIMAIVERHVDGPFEWNIRAQREDGEWVDEAPWQEEAGARDWWRHYESMRTPVQLVKRRRLSVEDRGFEVVEARG